MKINIKNLATKAVKEMHVDFAKKVRKTEKKANIALLCMLATIAIQLTGQYILNIEWLEMIGRGTWFITYILWLWYLLKGGSQAREGCSMQHMFINILTEDFPQFEIKIEGENPFNKVEEMKMGEAPKPTKKPRSRKVPVKSE